MFKYFFVLYSALLIFSGLAFANDRAVERPTNPCDNNTKCSDAMKSIATAFAQAGALDLKLIPSVYSGECYYLGQQYDAKARQFGMAFLDSKNNAYYVGGLFSFYVQDNPYSTKNVDEARKLSGDRLYNDNHRLEIESDFAFANMNKQATNPEQFLKYWYRQDKDNNLYILGQWGKSTSLLCRFTRHAN